MKKKLSLLSVIVFITSTEIFAQAQAISKFTAFRDGWVRPLYPIVAGIVFLVGAAMNLGLIQGQDKDYKKFFSQIGLYLLAMVAVVVVYEAISIMTI